MSAKYRKAAVRCFLVLMCIVSLFPALADESPAEEGSGGCEVVSFDAFEESQAVLTPAGEYKVTARRECANLSIRNTSVSARGVQDFLAIAVFGNGSIGEGGIEPGSGETKKLISPGETYNGMACLDSGSPIVILNCAVK